MISLVLLSAGLSRRFGSPKALIQFEEQSLLERMLREVVASRVDEVIVVLGADEDRIRPQLLNHTKVASVYNKDYNLGQTSSFQAGLRRVSGKSMGVMLLPIDVPFVKKETLNDLIDFFGNHSPAISIPTFMGRKGHPPVFHSRLTEALLGLSSTVGINEIIRQYSSEVVFREVQDEGVVLTFNTPQEWNAIEQKLRRR